MRTSIAPRDLGIALLASMLLASEGWAAAPAFTPARPPTVDGAPVIGMALPAAERLLTQPLPKNLDGRLAFAYRVARVEGHPAGGRHWLLGDSVDESGIQVTIRFTAEPGEALARRLERAGCAPARLESGALANVGPVLTARCSWEGLWAASAMAETMFISPTFGYRIVHPQEPPVDNSGREVEAYPLSEAFYPNGGGGKGVVVCDIDSGADPFHPFFFQADGGAYAWIDVNGNGVFDPLIDAVDFNRNGAKDADEVLGVIKAQVTWYDWYTGLKTVYNTDPAFLAGYDWLFQDENGDHVRNQGPKAPYGDAKPTFGEQLYVADDVNRNGQLDLGERVLRLSTPKIRAMRTGGGFFSPPKTYRRGIDLAQAPESYPGANGHGTMVIGTIAGGTAGLTRYAGIAPDADLLLASHNLRDLVSILAWARAEGAQIVQWEMAIWSGEFLDGSSNLEVACDAASDQGVLQLAAAGNLGGSQKHRVMQHPAGSTIAVPLVVPDGQADHVFGDFLWQSSFGAALSFSLDANGVTVPLSGQNGTAAAGSATVTWGRSTSPRGTEMLLFQISTPQGLTLPGQTLNFSVINTGNTVTLHGYVSDNFTSWGKGVYWPASTGATDLGTYGTPAVGDKTLAVASYYAELLPAGATKGGLAYYSGQGPRLDGLDTIDFAAPEDHISARVGQGLPFASMWVGGGTSNALPVATGVAAVLKGLNPAATPAQLAGLMRDYALAEPGMGTLPNDLWGHGKLRTYRAHFKGQPAPVEPMPVAAGSAVRVDASTVLLDASASSDPDGQPLRYRWDLDYDGNFDLGPVDGPVQTVALPAPDLQWMKLEVADPNGRVAQAVIPITDPPAAGSGGDEGHRRGCGCGSGADTGLGLGAMAALGLRLRRRRAASK